MKIVPERPFTIDGIKSWIHCLERQVGRWIDESEPGEYHFHDYIELLYAIDTDGYVWFNGCRTEFRSGDLVIVNSNVPHNLTFNSDSIYICIKFSPQILYADEEALFEFKYMLPFMRKTSDQNKFGKDELESIDVSGLLYEIMDEWKNQDPAYELIIRANLLKLFAGIFRHRHEKNILDSEFKITDTLKTALKYIEENFDTVTESEVAEHCHVSYNYFSFIFKKTMGKNFSEYITFLRLCEAEKLLLASDKSITEIATETGFSTSSYFISKFKAYKGITPRRFRENVRSETA